MKRKMERVERKRVGASEREVEREGERERAGGKACRETERGQSVRADIAANEMSSSEGL